MTMFRHDHGMVAMFFQPRLVYIMIKMLLHYRIDQFPSLDSAYFMPLTWNVCISMQIYMLLLDRDCEKIARQINCVSIKFVRDLFANLNCYVHVNFPLAIG